MEKADIKQWLKAIGKNREWLSSQCGITIPTLNGIMYGPRPIPRQTGRIIKLLMAQYPATANTPATPPGAAENAVVLTVNDSTFDLWNRAASAEKKLLRQWCVDVINEHVTATPPPDSTE